MEAGAVFSLKYPFVRSTFTEWDEEGPSVAPTWKPGVEFVSLPPYGEDTEAVCDGEGQMVLTVVDVHKPASFPTRVFFTRSWIDPEDKKFGKGGLHIMTQQAFRRRIAGYMHEYRVRTAEEASPA